MAHNQAMLEKKAEEWKGKVRIIGLSIDQDREKVVTHVAAKKWEAVEHYHRSTSDCSQVYGVRGVPHVMLLDQDGTIVFKGHPAGRKNLEEDLDILSRGEKLTGEGISELKTESAEAETEAKEEPVPEGFSEQNTGELSKEIESFKEVCTGFQKDEDL